MTDRPTFLQPLQPRPLRHLRHVGDGPSDAARRQALRGAGALVLLLGSAELAWGASIVAVRVWPAKDYSRVTIESDAVLDARHFLLPGDRQRLVIDVDGLDLSPALRELVGKIQADDPFIAGLRVGQFKPRVVRLVVDLKQAVDPQIFTLKPVAVYQHRLVFDLYPQRERDLLLDLVRDRERAESEAAQTVQDALGDLIGTLRKPPPGTGAPPVAPPTPPEMAALPPAPASQPLPGSSPAPKPALPPTAAEQEVVDRLIIVAIDPGHGGEDPGAIGPSGLKEKDVVLAIALKLRDRINAIPGMRAMLTRDSDFFVPLKDRVRKAQRVQADLFVSIHADAFTNPQAKGASVFALSERGASSAAARWMASRENASDEVGGLSEAALKDRDLGNVMADLTTSAQIKDSLKLGAEVLSRIKHVGRLHKRSVEQAGFAVLKAPDIPSILVETAFISNPEEEARLASDAYREQLVGAVFTGIRRYFARNPPMARRRTL